MPVSSSSRRSATTTTSSIGTTSRSTWAASATTRSRRRTSGSSCSTPTRSIRSRWRGWTTRSSARPTSGRSVTSITRCIPTAARMARRWSCVSSSSRSSSGTASTSCSPDTSISTSASRRRRASTTSSRGRRPAPARRRRALRVQGRGLRSGSELHAGRDRGSRSVLPGDFTGGTDRRLRDDPSGRPAPMSLTSPVKRAFRFAIDHYVALPVGVVAALIWVQVHAESYFRFSHASSFVVNEVGMAFFLAVMTKEIVEALSAGGALHSWRLRSMAIVAGVGGMIGAALDVLRLSGSRGRTVRARPGMANHVRRRSRVLLLRGERHFRTTCGRVVRSAVSDCHRHP